MTSEERKQARYVRRKEEKEKKKKEFENNLPSYDELFSFANLYEAFFECRKGVRWKSSVISYEARLLLETERTFEKMKKRKYKPAKSLEFDLFERGKLRHIMASPIQERCVQKVLCDKYLTPIVRRYIIYDNSASLKKRGPDFSVKRMKSHLCQYFKKYGRKGYIFQYDFRKYFENVDHEILIEMLKQIVPDLEIMKVIEKIINSFGVKGLGLGSQLSQICAIYFPTSIDQAFKQKLKIRWYGRYNDDGYALCRNKREVEDCIKTLKKEAYKLNIELNPKKIHITKLTKRFTYLKKTFYITDTGGIVVKMKSQTITAARRRLKRLFNKLESRHREKLTIAHIDAAYKTWIGRAKKYKNYHAIKNYKELYEKRRRKWKEKK